MAIMATKTTVTLGDVAKAAGVSMNTASVVMRGDAARGRIAPDTAQRVEKAAEKLGYRHNAMARSLSAGRSNLVGIMCHTEPRYHLISARHAAQALIAAGYQVSMQDLAWQPEHEGTLIKELLSLQVEGILLESGAAVSAEEEGYQLLLKLIKKGFPITHMSGGKGGLAIDQVDVDRELGAYTSTCHLLGLGHRHIAYIVPVDFSSPYIQARLQGFHRAHREAGMEVNEELILWPANNEEMKVLASENPFVEHSIGRRALSQLLQRKPRATAVLGANDYVGMGVISAALEAGIKVPDDIAVVGFSGYPEAELASVPLTTVAYPTAAMAHEGVRMLLERIGGLSYKKVPPRSVTLEPELVVRRSCGAIEKPTVDERVPTLDFSGRQVELAAL